MHRRTQIGYHTLTDSFITNMQQVLAKMDIDVTHPQDGIIVSKGPWSEYEAEVELYDSLRDSSFHIIANEDSQITPDLARQVLFAMTKRRPIIFLRKPRLSSDVDPFTKDLISNHLPAFTIADIPSLGSSDLSKVLQHMPSTVDYELDPTDTTLIKARVKAYFRDLLQKAKVQRTA